MDHRKVHDAQLRRSERKMAHVGFAVNALQGLLCSGHTAETAAERAWYIADMAITEYDRRYPVRTGTGDGNEH